MNIHRPADMGQVDLCRDLGVEWTRIDVDWDALEPSRGKPNWAPLDWLVPRLRQAGLKIFATVAYSPPWANGGRERRHPPLNGHDYAAFLRLAVARYRADISHWGLWNEPNLDEFFAGTADDYLSRVLIPGADAVRQADPEATICGPDLSHRGKPKDREYWYKWMEAISAQAGDKLDVLAHHVYKEPTSLHLWRALDGPTLPFFEAPSLQAARTCLRLEDKPLWITEIGWSSARIGEQAQAENYARLFDGLTSRTWIDKVFFYDLVDDPSADATWGIVTSDGRKKAAFPLIQGHMVSCSAKT